MERREDGGGVCGVRWEGEEVGKKAWGGVRGGEGGEEWGEGQEWGKG